MIAGLALAPALDVTYEVDALVRGGIARPTRVTRVAGGKTLNMLRAARSVGGDVRAIAALGGPVGEWITELLAADGVEVDVIRLGSVTRTCLAVVERDGGASSTDVYEPATPLSPAEWADFADAAVATANSMRGGWVALSGSVPTGSAADGIASLLERIHASGARIALDGSGAGLSATVGHASLVKINLSEAQELLGTHVADSGEACRAIRERWGCDVVVTDGVRGGAGLVDGAESVFAPPAAQGRFPAGSGDAFLGALLVALEQDGLLDDALDAARSAAERNASCPGQGILGPAER